VHIPKPMRDTPEPPKKLLWGAAAFGGLGVLSGLAASLWQSRRQITALRAALKFREANPATATTTAPTAVGTKCSWQFKPPLYVEKGISAQNFMVIDKLEQLTTELFADGDQIVLKIIPAVATPLWMHFYQSLIFSNRFQVTDFEFPEQPSLGYWDILSGTPRVTLKLQWLQVFYARLTDTVTVIFQFDTSVGSLLAGETIIRGLFENVPGVTFKSVAGGNNRFEVSKTNFLASWGAAAPDNKDSTVDKLYGLVYYLKYAHMASPELINALLLRLPANHPWVERLKRLREHLTTKCRLVPAESIQFEKPR